MMLDNFPRGGGELPDQHSIKLFQKKKKSLKKNIELESKVHKLSQNNVPLLDSADNLTYSSLQEGMNILGRVHRITDYYAVIALPGQIYGKLSILNISEAYTKLLRTVTSKKEVPNKLKTLSDLFKEGDYLICCIKESNSNQKKVLLSIEPRLINQSLNLNCLKVSYKIAVSIQNVEDHGYSLETGLNNFQAFLPFDKIVNNSLNTGKQVVCVITDIKNVDNSYFVKLSALPSDVEKTESKTLPINNLIPNTKHCLTVTKILHNGLEVYFDENRIGYVNHLYVQKPLTVLKVGQKLDGVLLYILPMVKIAYFSLVSQKCEQDSNLLLTCGTIFNAKVLTHDSKGVVVELSKNVHGFIPFKRTKFASQNVSSIFKISSLHKCKITAYDLISKLYICSFEKNCPETNLNSKANLKPGDEAEVTVTNVDEINKLITVSVGKNVGIVPQYHVSDPKTPVKLVVGQLVRAKVLESSDKLIFTLKKSLVESKLPILYKIEDAKLNSVYHGTVFKITSKGVLVYFFGNVEGWIPRRSLNNNSLSQNCDFTLGQTISVVIKSVDLKKKRLWIAPLNDKKIHLKVNVGDILDGFVIDSSSDGLHIRVTVEGEDEIAFLPAGHMSPCQNVGELLAMKTTVGCKLSAIVFSTTPHLVLSTTFSPEKTYKLSDLKIGKLVICSILNFNKEFINVLMPVEKSAGCYKILKKNVDNIESIYKYQICFCKILDIDKKTNQINLTAQLNQVCNEFKMHDLKILTAVDLLSMYLSKIFELSRNIYYTSRPISKFFIGQRIKAIVETTTNHGLILKLDGNVKGIVHSDNCSKSYKSGDTIEGLILWINYPYEFVEITLLQHIYKMSTRQNELSGIPIGVQLRGIIVLVNHWFIMVILTGQKKGTLVVLPTRRNLNDTLPDLTLYQIGSKVKVYSVLNKDNNILIPICIIKSAFESQNFVCEKFSNSLRSKRKLELDFIERHTIKKFKKNNEDNAILNLENKKNYQEQIKETTKGDIIVESKKDTFIETDKQKSIQNKVNNSKKIYQVEKGQADNKSLSSLVILKCGFKWENDIIHKINNQMHQSSSSDSEEETKVDLGLDKVQSAKKFKTEKAKEKKVCDTEDIVVNYQTPQSVDEFEMLVLANPNSSLVWIQYMTYHLHAMEVDKARSIAERALKIINFREESEKLNVWKSLLNLESQFGSLESLNVVFKNASKMNDAKKIYEHMLSVHAEAGRNSEVEKIINLMLKKFKHDMEVWIICVTVFVKVGMLDQARHIMQKAEQYLPRNKYVEFIVKFAQLENKFGSKEKSQALFENILSSYPNRTDIWSKYVDALIKSKNIDIARKVLDRALSKTMPLKKIKFIFKKYLNFEEHYGTQENFSRIKQMAVKYIDEQYNRINAS